MIVHDNSSDVNQGRDGPKKVLNPAHPNPNKLRKSWIKQQELDNKGRTIFCIIHEDFVTSSVPKMLDLDERRRNFCVATMMLVREII